jgi:hypothetical protein
MAGSRFRNRVDGLGEKRLSAIQQTPYLRFRVAMDGDHDVVARNLDRRHQLLKFAVMQKKALRPFQARLECSEEARCFASGDGAMIESEG